MEAWFFAETESSHQYIVGEMWTHSTFSIHITAAKMKLLPELIKKVFPGIEHRFCHTVLETLVKDIHNR